MINVRVIAEKLNVRNVPSLDGEVIDIVNKNDVFSVDDVVNGFGKLVNEDGWIMLEHTIVEIEDEDETEVEEDEIQE